MSSGICAACRRSIDASAKLCPYCGANPVTGERVDTQAILQEIFRPKDTTASENVMEFARQRQGIVIGVSVGVIFLLLALLHQFVTARNDRAVSDAPAVPLTEIADVANQPETKTVALPELDFQYEGRPQTMQTFITERAAAAPAPPASPPPATTTTAGPVIPRPQPR